MTCCFCRRPVEEPLEYSIHRCGMGKGAEVPLCKPCAENDEITCEMIWAHNARKGR